MRCFLLLCCAALCGCATLLSQTTVSVQFADAQRRHRVDVPTGQVRLQLCGLTLGHSYRVIASPAFADGSQSPQLSLAPDAQPEFAQRPNEQRFIADGPCADLWVNAQPDGGSGLVPLSISAACADCPDADSASEAWKKKFKEKVGGADVAKLSVSPGTPAASLVRNTLIGGDCFDVTNITFYGNSDSRGTFATGTSSINIAEGVVLCTGNVNELPGPNTAVDADGGFSDNNTDDPDLKKLISNNQYDLSKIEFDFVPTANTVKFEFVFGSEEYCEFVGTSYNDVFGFFISGPGINGTLNIGLVPGTNTPITINDLNHIDNSTYYRNNRLDALNCGGWPAVAGADIELDGFTKVITATATVQPCQKYHIKLAIADIQDEKYCSAVFLKANSFNAGGQVEAEAVYANSQTNAIENCGQSHIKFKRGSGDASTALAVSYSIAPQSTALQGIDFAALPTSIIIPAGQTEVLVPVTLFQDGMAEGVEKIVLTINNSCSCTEQKVEFLINDKPLLNVSMTDKAICGGQAAVLSPTVSGGLNPILYKWSNGETGSSLTVNASGTNTYSVTVTDACASTEVVSANVTAQEVPTATLSGGGTLCIAGNTATLSVNLGGQSPWNLSWKADNGTPQTQTVFTSPALIPISAAGSYTLVSVATQGGCTGTVSGSAAVTTTNLNLGLNAVSPLCNGISNGSIGTSLTGGSQPYTYLWNNGAKTQNINGLPPGTYTVTITENSGCTATQTAQLTQPTALLMAAEVKNHINCKMPTGAADLTATGGTPSASGSYQVKWSNGATQPAATFATGGTYTVTVSDQNNCTTTAALTILSDLAKPTALAKALGQLDCNSDEVGLDATGSSAGAQYAFVWSGGPFTCCENTFTPTVDQPGTYTLLVTNSQNGCTATATTLVTENTNEPTALSLALDPPGCSNPNGNIGIVGVTGGTGPYRYELNGSGTFGTLAQFNGLRPGLHEIIVQDANGCEYADTVVFQEVILPEITLVPEVKIAFGETQRLTATLNIPLSQVDTIIWSPSEGITPTGDMRVVDAQPFTNTRYTATVISKNGCEDRATVQFKVDEPHIWAPNVFSPNNKDGENDRFYLFASPGSVRQVVSMQVFDRWGALLFLNKGGATDTERIGWDGTFNGKMLDPAVFIWCADVELANGDRVQLKGDVSIVR